MGEEATIPLLSLESPMLNAGQKKRYLTPTITKGHTLAESLYIQMLPGASPTQDKTSLVWSGRVA